MTPYYSRDGITIYHADCRDVLPTLAAGSVDLVLTDPPYGIGYQSARQTDTFGRHRQTATAFGADRYDGAFWPDMVRVMASNSLAFVFTRWDMAHYFKTDAEAAGLACVQRLIWDKMHWGTGDLRYYGSQTEDALLFRQGAPVFQWAKRRGNVWRYPSKACFPEGVYDHPAQKPLDLLRSWTADASCEGALMLDPFMGSGTTLRAALDLGRRAIGIEIEERYCEIAARRLQQSVLPLVVG
jgi:site-specific DNA-methyltransferase (adenine-specific)